MNQIIRERKPAKVGAVFDSKEAADAAVADITTEQSLNEAWVMVITPDDPRYERKLQPETRGIWKTAVGSHLILGLLGLVAGAALYGGLHATGVAWVTNTSLLGLIPFLSVGLLVGMMLGGLITLRPDQDRIWFLAQTAREQNRWLVVVHGASQASVQRAREMLTPACSEIATSF
ncbi:MAG: hypothetical protein SV765_02890 [Pseudomonadota bacterium]|mgnify:CR=1 FL=1|nr:hypothetical protein [Pseudomonadales bacterium]MDY6919142.1 hypothetical protein [Pseudomonadota bacterium]